MKAAGVQGVLIDWYGIHDVNDYAMIHRNTALVMDVCDRAELRYAIVYEDQTLPKIAEKLGGRQVKDLARETLQWVGMHWFRRRGYLRWQGRPLLLVFGPQQLTSEADWVYALDGIEPRPALLTLHDRKVGADGAFDWPLPQVGEADSWRHLEAFNVRSKAWQLRMAVAFPRFHDYYAEAKVGPSYGRIADAGGETFRRSLEAALASGAPFVQIATWNDWGEGTQIEPSLEMGRRDLDLLRTLLADK